MEWTPKDRARQKELQAKLFGTRDGVAKIMEEAEPAEVLEFQHYRARSHQKFFHYTSLTALLGMLETKCLYLPDLRESNDLREAGGLENVGTGRLYAASFSWPNKESIAMWWMYGLKGTTNPRQRVPVRLEFNGDAVRADVEKARASRKQFGGKVDFYDVIYRDYRREPGEANTWYLNGRPVRMAWHFRSGAGRNVFGDDRGLVKDRGWDYERETRIRVDLPDAEVPRIEIPFEEALKSAKVLVGPGQSASDYLKIAQRKLEPWGIEATPSRCRVRFPEWNPMNETGRARGRQSGQAFFGTNT